MVDNTGVIYKGREKVDEWKARWAIDTDKRTLTDAFVGTDVAIGLSTGGIFKEDMIKSMND